MVTATPITTVDRTSAASRRWWRGPGGWWPDRADEPRRPADSRRVAGPGGRRLGGADRSRHGDRWRGPGAHAFPACAGSPGPARPEGAGTAARPGGTLGAGELRSQLRGPAHLA